MTSHHNALLARLSRADEADFFSHLTEFNAPKRTVLYQAGEDVEYVYFPTAGMISLLTMMDDGQCLETSAVGREGAAGFNAALSGRNINCRAVVQLDLQSFRMSKVSFRQAFSGSPGVRRIVHHANELLIDQIQRTAACHVFHSTEARLARWLLQTQDHAGKAEIDLTQEYLAEMLGVLRSTVSVVAARFQKDGLIRYRRGHLNILNRTGLVRLCCECYQPLSSPALPEKDRKLSRS